MEDTLAIHQPNYLPWMGYFAKMALVDSFVYLDHVEYTKSGYTRRTKIVAPNNSNQWLTVPLLKHGDHTPINHLEIANQMLWVKKQKNKLYENYHKLPFFHEGKDLLLPLLDNADKTSYLIEFNISIIEAIKDIVGLSCKTTLSSTFSLTTSANDVNIQIADLLKMNTYLSGVGGSKYQFSSDFEARNIQLKVVDFKKLLERTIPCQSILPYIHLSVFDIICRIGIHAFKKWLESIKEVYEQM